MSKMKVILVWIEPENKWHMLREEDGRFIQEFYDCDNIHNFMSLNKEFINAFELTSRALYVSHVDCLPTFKKEWEAFRKDDKSRSVDKENGIEGNVDL